MIEVEDVEKIRIAYFRDGLSIREISRTQHHSRRVIRRAIESADPGEYRMVQERPAPVLGPWKAKIDALWDESQPMPRKQRYTARTIYQELQKEGYTGSEVTVSRYVGQKRQASRAKQVFLPLEFDPGADAQVDWGEAVVELAGERVTVPLFIMRLNYSPARFGMAFPFQKQEAFFEGHIQAFRFFGAVPKRITYDNLKTAVYRILSGRNRQEQVAFVAVRSHYLCESRYCTPGQGHEKGGVESDVGFSQRHFRAPRPRGGAYEELNNLLAAACRRDLDRRVRGSQESVAAKLATERPLMLERPHTDSKAYREHLATVNPSGLVPLDTNRYSVPGPVSEAVRGRAYAFRVEILAGEEIIAQPPRCVGQEQDVIEPVPYLTALVQRPGAFEHAVPMRRWRAEWPPVYETLLAELRRRWPDERGLREFLDILALHKDHPSELIVQAVETALKLGAVHLDGVQLCLRQLTAGQEQPPALDLSGHDRLAGIGQPPVNLGQYDTLLSRR
ncbi:MAG: IS21 family transposase [Ardenticatenaceae bacterium]|nr:IS21 family transposase [Ardenticatenaceae bacterium]